MPPEKREGKENRDGNEAKEGKDKKEANKVVVRLLPPEIPEEAFVGTIEKYIGSVSWSQFLEGKRYKGDSKPSLNTRVYLSFENRDAAEVFMKEYHGHTFVDDKGEQFRAVCALAPYQKAPRTKVLKDPRDGTIEDDAIYKEWCEKRHAPKENKEDGEKKPILTEEDKDIYQTPLVKYMAERAWEKKKKLQAEKRAKKKEKEEKRWLETVEEDWQDWKCADCGGRKKLEEDPESGNYYCKFCWKAWGEAKPKKKKKKKDKNYEEEEWVEEKPEKEKRSRKSRKEKGEGEWRAKKKGDEWASETWDESWGEEHASEKKKKRKKKEKEEEYWEEKSSSRRRGRKSDDQWSESWSETTWKPKKDEESSSRSSRRKKKSDEGWDKYWTAKAK